MAAILRTPLNAAGGALWDEFAAQVSHWAAGNGLALRDTIVLVPFTALLAPAREAFARRAGWQPRVETTRTCAAASGPSTPALPMQLSFDLPADRLVAASILRDQTAGRELLRKDPRRFDRMVMAIVATAQALAQAAHARAPEQRADWWAQARGRLAPIQGPGAQQRWLARLALEWAAQTLEPATDRLFAVRPAAWVALQAGGPEPLIESLFEHASADLHCLVIDADVGALAALSNRSAVALARCDDLEHEAQCAAAQVLRHLERGEWPVALAGLDRQLVRRVRALLERQNVALADETGWTLATTRAGALVMAMLRAASPRASSDALFDWLKALPPWPDIAAAALADLERLCRRRGVARAEVLFGLGLQGDVAVLIERMRELLWPLREGRLPLLQWLERLRVALQRSGAWTELAADDAGIAVLRALRLETDDAAGPAWQYSATSSVMGPESFVDWADAVLEGANFTPAAPAADAVRVVITPLARAMLRPFAALVCPGADDRHLGAASPAHALLSDADEVALGLGGRAERQRREALAFAHAMAIARISLFRRRVDVNGETFADSPLLQRMALDLAQQGRSFDVWLDPRRPQALETRPLLRPQPVAAGALPARLSVSAIEALRDCPYRFFSRHVLGLREDEELDAEPEKRDYGEWLHRVLLAFHRQRGTPSAAATESATLQHIAAQETAAMGLAEDQFLPFAASFERFVPAYLAWLHQRDAEGFRWQGGERELRLRPAGWGEVELQGVIDRIDRADADGGLELIDYKTSSVQRLRERVRYPLEDTQLALYAALMSPEGGSLRSACYLPLDTGAEIKPVVHDGVQRSAEVLLRELGGEFDRLRAGESLPALGEGAVCEVCEARGLCRRDHWPDGETE